jgi:hypothetical protein
MKMHTTEELLETGKVASNAITLATAYVDQMVYDKLSHECIKLNTAFGKTIQIQYPGDFKSVVGKGLLY